ncbi:30S ribosomal protein S6e [Candidatus Woesearchaeota archaeon]|nr:30S ribosomal protein S6e [Candidatus Woesearchaeota archaeon]MBT4322297.1 30S ribosomal protein S6e [Candidatus Woesearchaeota archaeon]MBT4630860.1 30S ribosomal protein S6e [Candidatus Woesearchaeota archaeon]
MFKLTINDVKAKKSYKKEVESDIFMNKKIGEKVSGDEFGFKGYEFTITGGSDKQGFPMRSDVPGIGRKRPLVVSGVGVKNKVKGMKQRKTMHGNTVDENVSQVNLKVEKYGKDTLPKLLGLEKEPEKTEEAPKTEEKPVEEVKEEPKPEEKKVEEKPKEE